LNLFSKLYKIVKNIIKNKYLIKQQPCKKSCNGACTQISEDNGGTTWNPIEGSYVSNQEYHKGGLHQQAQCVKYP